MSDTPIHKYYPQNPEEEAPKSLVAGEAPASPNEPVTEEEPLIAEPVRPHANSEEALPTSQATPEEWKESLGITATEVTDLGIDLPDIPLPDDDPIEESVKDAFDDAAFNFAIVGVGQGGSRLA